VYGLWPASEGDAPVASTYARAAQGNAVIAALVRPRPPGAPTKVALPVLGAVAACVAKNPICRAVATYLFWLILKVGYNKAAPFWNNTAAPFFEKKLGVSVPRLAPSWQDLSTDAFELLKQLWGLISNDPFPLNPPPAPLQPGAPRAPASPPKPTPAPASPSGGSGLFGVGVAVSVGIGALLARRRRR